MEMYWATNLKPSEQEDRAKTSLDLNLRINVSQSNPISISNSTETKLKDKINEIEELQKKLSKYEDKANTTEEDLKYKLQ